MIAGLGVYRSKETTLNATTQFRGLSVADMEKQIQPRNYLIAPHMHIDLAM
jgi:hypothetical protein